MKKACKEKRALDGVTLEVHIPRTKAKRRAVPAAAKKSNADDSRDDSSSSDDSSSQASMSDSDEHPQFKIGDTVEVYWSMLQPAE